MSSDEETKFNRLLEALGEATESIEEKITNDEFLDLIEKLNKKHPLMYLPDLLNDFVQGDTLVKMLDRHHLTEHSKVQQLFENSLKFKLNHRTKNLFCQLTILINTITRKIRPYIQIMRHVRYIERARLSATCDDRTRLFIGLAKL